MESTRCGVVILNYNTYDDTRLCVESIKRYEGNASYSFKIYIVDNQSPDGSGDRLADLYRANEGSIDVCFADSNGGFSKGNNIGIRKALADGCDYVFLLNSDIELLNNALTIMTDVFENSLDIAIVGPAVFDQNGRYAQFARKALTAKSLFWSTKPFECLSKKRRDKLRIFEYDQNDDFVFSGIVSGCCFGIRSSWIKANGLLDERVFMYYEEDILAHKLITSGNVSCICHNAKVIHKEGVSTKRVSKDGLLFQRFHRWNSSVYVISHYGRNPRWSIWGASAFFSLSWLLLSLKSLEYRKQCKSFLESQKRMIRR